MRRISIVTREDLLKEHKLLPVEKIFACCFNSNVQGQIWENSDIVLFHCSLTSEYKLIKYRYGAMPTEVLKVESPEEESRLLFYLIGN